MDRPDRKPGSCPYRDAHGAGSGRWSCSLVKQIMGDLAAHDYEVKPAVCERCCQHPLPVGAGLNPVVASLVFDQVQLARAATGESGQIDCHAVHQFAKRWLALDDSNPDSDCVTVANGPTIAQSLNGRVVSPPLRSERQPRIGLVGPHSGFGLAHQTRDIAKFLPIDRWLVWGGGSAGSERPCRMDFISRPMSPSELEAWLDGLDAVLFVESPVFPQLTSIARKAGVAVICIPNWEWLHPGLVWLDDVDLMICPTRYTAERLSDWRCRFRFGWGVKYVAWPVDMGCYQFQCRKVCRQFIYVNGTGGYRASPSIDAAPVVRRKGFEILLAAAARVPEIPIIAYADSHDLPSVPANVDLRPLPPHNSLLYCDGDVCVQPSQWEGLGLPLLECQAAGMPLITADQPPMNEHQPLAVIPIRGVRAMYLNREICIPVAHILPEELASVLRSVHGKNISSASRRARRYIRRNHNWVNTAPQIARLIRDTTRAASGTG